MVGGAVDDAPQRTGAPVYSEAVAGFFDVFQEGFVFLEAELSIQPSEENKAAFGG